MIIRTVKNKDNPYYLKNRTAPNDPRLTWKAKGVHDYLMSKPDHWEAVINELVTASADGEATVRSAINELIEFGYMHRAREINELGRVIRWRLDAYEAPDMNPYFVANEPHCTFPHVGEPHLACPHVENQALVINDLAVSNEKLVSNENLENRGDPSIQDLPGTTKAIPPTSPKAKIINQVLATSPTIKANAVTENAPVLINTEAGPAAGHRNPPSQQGIIGLVQASADKFSGNGHRNRVQCHIDGLKSKLERRGIDVPMLVKMTDKVLDEMGRTALANGESEAADTALREAQQFIADLTEIGKRFWMIDGIVSVFRSWEVNDKRPRPSYKQLLEHASLMVAGKVEKQTAGVTGPRYDFSKPDKPDKKWLLDTYQQDNLDYIVMEVPRDKQLIAKANILKKWSELCKQ